MKRFTTIEQVNNFFKDNLYGINGGGYSDCILELKNPTKYVRGVIPAGIHHVECYNGDITICDESHMIAEWYSGEVSEPFGCGEMHTNPCIWGTLKAYHGMRTIITVSEYHSGKSTEILIAERAFNVEASLKSMCINEISPLPYKAISKIEKGFVIITYHGLFNVTFSEFNVIDRFNDIKTIYGIKEVINFMKSFKK